MTEQEKIRVSGHLQEMEEIKSRCEGISIPFELLKEYYGATMCCIHKNEFLKKFEYRWIEKGIREEIEEMETFIKNAENRILKDAFYAGKWGYDTNEFRYLRLKYNYYLDNNLKDGDLGIGCHLPSVYGKYFLFYELLKAKLAELNEQKKDGTSLLLMEQPEQNTSNYFIDDTLAPLSWNNGKGFSIMPLKEYNRLLEYCIYVATNNKLPKIIKAQKTHAKAIFIRYSFYLIWKHYGSTTDKITWIEFIKAAFSEFDNASTATISSSFHKAESYNDTIKELRRINEK